MMGSFDVPVVSDSEVLIPAEHKEAAQAVRAKLEELERIRAEIGRLHQVLGNVSKAANQCESSAKAMKQGLCDVLDIEQDGSWAIDFENEKFVKVDKTGPAVV